MYNMFTKNVHWIFPLYNLQLIWSFLNEIVDMNFHDSFKNMNIYLWVQNSENEVNFNKMKAK